MKRFLILIGGMAVLVILALGAYTAVQLMAQPEPTTSRSGGGRVMQSVSIGNDGVPVIELSPMFLFLVLWVAALSSK
ncbi:MAG: hypothetical protein R3293_12865 [Candidatus Promineifilaceae bacterium]|nr:hypothetical protein [Candidatus Promineifilaceae bacterium]